MSNHAECALQAKRAHGQAVLPNGRRERVTAVARGQLAVRLVQPLRVSGLRGTLPMRKQQYVRVPLKQCGCCWRFKQQQHEPLEKGTSALGRLEHEELLGGRNETECRRLDLACLPLLRPPDTRCLDQERASQRCVLTSVMDPIAEDLGKASTTLAAVRSFGLAAVNGTRTRSVAPGAYAKNLAPCWKPVPAIIAVTIMTEPDLAAADTVRQQR